MTRPLALRLLGYAAVWLLLVVGVTELVGWLFAWPSAFGGWPVAGITLYPPGAFVLWRDALAPADRWIVDVAAGLCAAVALALAVRVWLDGRGDRLGRFGAGRWARRADVHRSGLLREDQP